MPRTAAPATVSKATPMNESAVQEEMAAANQLATITRDTEANVVALAQQLGYDGALSVGALEDGIRFYQQRTAEACMQLGVRLALLKQTCSHGDFKPRLELLGIEYGAAKRFMAVASKFSKGPTSALLKAANSQSKLIELLVLDDSEVMELDEGGTVLGLTVDDVDRMGVRELRAKLREARAEKEADDKLMADKNAKLDKLSRRIQKAKPDEVLAELHKETTAYMSDAKGCIQGQLRKAFFALRDHDAHSDGDSLVFMAGLVGQLQAELNSLRESFELPDLSTAADQALAADVAKWAQ